MSVHKISIFAAVMVCSLFAVLSSPKGVQGQSDELILGTEYVAPGVQFIFEGAVKDVVYPKELHLAEDQADVHIEARVTWATDKSKDVPEGAVRGGFVPYLNITAEVVNNRTGETVSTELVPHVNKTDNFHYARNIDLPGTKDDTYKVVFSVNPPQKYDLSYHKGWKDTYGDPLFEAQKYTYEEVTFASVVDRTRR